MCLGLSDREDWLELNDRDVKDIPPEVKSVLDQAEAKVPPPVAGPDMGPAVDPDAGADAVVGPRAPNVPILAKPPIKVRVVFVLIYFTSINISEKVNVLESDKIDTFATAIPNQNVEPAKICHVNYSRTHTHNSSVRIKNKTAEYKLYLLQYLINSL